MKLKNNVTILDMVIVVIALLAMVPGGTADARAIYKDVPGKIDTKARYLFYLHGRIIEIKGIRPTSERYGVYEYEKILETFKDKGFIVISEARPRGTGVSGYARKVVSRVNALLHAGVPAGNITVVGASKGALIAMMISSMLRNKDMNFVFISGCTHQVLQKFDIDFWGNVLTIYDEKDELVGTCKKFFEVSTGLNHYKEIKLTVGTGHGILYRPIKEWVDPVVKWARGQR
jgi:hypothetical protein